MEHIKIIIFEGKEQKTAIKVETRALKICSKLFFFFIDWKVLSDILFLII